MKFVLSERAVRDYDSLSSTLQASVDKQLAFLLRTLRHPSLRAKKYNESLGIWQGRITRDYRFYFRIEGDTYQIISITKHPK
ncbi:MAG: type II toxin-antitoxin system RelE/ParE family toxin [Candidatus Binatia bacterium]